MPVYAIIIQPTRYTLSIKSAVFKISLYFTHVLYTSVFSFSSASNVFCTISRYPVTAFSYIICIHSASVYKVRDRHRIELEQMKNKPWEHSRNQDLYSSQLNSVHMYWKSASSGSEWNCMHHLHSHSWQSTVHLNLRLCYVCMGR